MSLQCIFLSFNKSKFSFYIFCNDCMKKYICSYIRISNLVTFFSANIVKTHFVIKMLPLVASEVRKYSLHTCEIHFDLSTCLGR